MRYHDGALVFNNGATMYTPSRSMSHHSSLFSNLQQPLRPIRCYRPEGPHLTAAPSASREIVVDAAMLSTFSSLSPSRHRDLSSGDVTCVRFSGRPELQHVSRELETVRSVSLARRSDLLPQRRDLKSCYSSGIPILQPAGWTLTNTTTAPKLRRHRRPVR